MFSRLQGKGSTVQYSFLNYFKTLSVGPVLGIEPATCDSAIKRFTDWANHAAYFETLQREAKTKTKLNIIID